MNSIRTSSLLVSNDRIAMTFAPPGTGRVPTPAPDQHYTRRPPGMPGRSGGFPAGLAATPGARHDSRNSRLLQLTPPPSRMSFMLRILSIAALLGLFAAVHAVSSDPPT